MWDDNYEDEYFQRAQRDYMDRVQGDGDVPSAEQLGALNKAAQVLNPAQRTTSFTTSPDELKVTHGLAEALMYVRAGAPAPLRADEVSALADRVLEVRRTTSGQNPPGYANSEDEELTTRWRRSGGTTPAWTQNAR